MNVHQKTFIIGICATLCIDAWGLILEMYGVTSRGILFLGRYLSHLLEGTFIHDNIMVSNSIPGELFLGYLGHYSIGILFAFLFIKIKGSAWFDHPRILPAIIFGGLTLIFPIILFQPLLGFGIAFVNLPSLQSMLLFKVTMIHLVYGVGLFYSTKALLKYQSKYRQPKQPSGKISTNG
jgi:hypothetical protein